ncbi:hypothetical protein OPQ81_000759 [Rhizoctonia solani]|nr:hypothetical protein OPQ81_000759 [Rhizoctonia solani]
MVAVAAPPKASWADDVDDFDVPQNSDTIDENGIRTIIEYSTNEEGKRVKTTRRIKRTLKKALVDHATAERKQWVKFGNEKGNKPGPDRATTTVGEALSLKLSAGPRNAEPEPDPDAAARAALGGKKILCRVCQGDHFTTKCPYKDTLGLAVAEDMPPPEDGPAARPEQSTGGKYVPPSMRAGAGRGGESMYKNNRDDLPTLRVTNVSEDTQEDDLRELFSKFGRVVRVYVGRDRETGAGKGYAFVSFEDKTTAERAIQKVNGMGYDNLILSVQWSQPREPRG